MTRGLALVAAAALVLALALGGCAEKAPPQPEPDPREIVEGQMFPMEAQEAVPMVLSISRALIPADPPDTPRKVEYFGLEEEGGAAYYTFTVYAEKERLENLGMFRKTVGREEYALYDEEAGGYKKVILENGEIRLEE